MISLILVSHGNFAQAALDACTMIAGEQEQLIAVSLAPTDSPESFQTALTHALNSIGSDDGVLILSDLLGGTPCNESLKLMQTHPLIVVTGLNLTMLLEVVVQRPQLSLGALAKLAVTAGHAGIQNASQWVTLATVPESEY